MDSNGNVVAAKATKMIYWIKYNISVVDGEEASDICTVLFFLGVFVFFCCELFLVIHAGR